MQPTIFAITLVIMAVTLVLILRAILPTTGPDPDENAPFVRKRLIWVMVVFGMVLILTERTFSNLHSPLVTGDVQK